MSDDCPHRPRWFPRLPGDDGHQIIGEPRWASDGKSVMVNRCIRCGEEERAEGSETK